MSRVTPLKQSLSWVHNSRIFSDTAAALQHLDLVITVDTSVAHLAGALGRPVWVLLPHAADWRWFQHAATDSGVSPWYPSMKLFHQGAPGDWQTLFTQFKSTCQNQWGRPSAPRKRYRSGVSAQGFKSPSKNAIMGI